MHILFLSDNFPPEVNAPASRTFEHCREWVRAGQQVTVITCVPNFPKGRVFDGYRNRLWQCETMDGIRVIRVWSYLTANEGFLKRVLDYLSFMVSSTLAALLLRGVDLVVGTSPQFFTVCAAYLVGRLKRIPFVFELRDLWPESIKAVGAMRESFLIRALQRLEMFLYQKAAGIVSVTHSFKSNLAARGVDVGKIAVVTNGVDMSRFRQLPKDAQLIRQLRLEGKFVVGYVGTHGLAHRLETLLAAADMIRVLPDGADCHFLLLGDGARKEALKEQAARLRLSNVTFLDSVAKERVVHYWSLIDAAVITLQKTALFSTVIPSKLFECMAMGIPVLHGVAGESAGIVEREKVGIVIEPENAEALVAGILLLKAQAGLYRELSANCLLAAKNYDRQVLADDMLQVLLPIALTAGSGETRPSV